MEDFGHKQYKYRLVYQPKKSKIKNTGKYGGFLPQTEKIQTNKEKLINTDQIQTNFSIFLYNN